MTDPRPAPGPDHQTVPVLRLEQVVKRFGRLVAVDSVSLDIAPGEFFSLLGPSGCGKTTTLRMLGGFDEPDEGRILLDGRNVTGVPPNRRDVNMVFQTYALFPHLDVARNVAYGLRRDKLPADEVDRRVTAMLDQVQLPRATFGRRRPRQLSGGQQQRVALARALVKRPRALLLDEPLGALDLQLRRGMQAELKRMQDELDVAFVYVTHDQEEALSMSDRIAVMDRGRVMQVGTPRELYARPRTRFVAGFLGTSNVIELPVDRVEAGEAVMRTPAPGYVRVDASTMPEGAAAVALALRPEQLRITAPDQQPADGCSLLGTVAASMFLGATVRCDINVPAVGTLVALEPADAVAREPGDRVVLTWRRDDAVVLDDAPDPTTAAAHPATAPAPAP